MNYTLNQLRVYLKVVQTRNITKAAEDLHLTQPAVSIQLKNFTQQFSIPLLQVVRKKLYVTEFGLEIAEAAEAIIEQVYAINYKMHAHQGELTGKLKIASASTGKYIAPFFLAHFMKQHAGIELMLDVTNKQQVLEALENNLIDFALVSVLPENMAYDKIELMENRLYLVGNADSSFPKKTYTKALFHSIPLIYREKGSGTRLVMEKFVQKNKIPVIKKMELTSNEAVKQSVIAGLGYSIMPYIGIQNELKQGQLQIIPIQGFPILSKWYLIWLKGKKLSPVAQAYLHYIKQHKQEIIEQKFEVKVDAERPRKSK